MKKRIITEADAVLAAVGFGASALAQPAAGAAGSGRPNILLIIADDIGIDVNSTMYPDLMALLPPDGSRRREIIPVNMSTPMPKL